MDYYIKKNDAVSLLMKEAKSHDLSFSAEAYERAANLTACLPNEDVQPIVDTKNMATVSDEFICKKCGIYLKDYIKVVMDEDNDGYIDEQHYDYEPKFCPECGARIVEEEV